jgi:hypothetical protein
VEVVRKGEVATPGAEGAAPPAEAKG